MEEAKITEDSAVNATDPKKEEESTKPSGKKPIKKGKTKKDDDDSSDLKPGDTIEFEF